MPDWARHPDREYLDAMERMRRRYASRPHRPLLLETLHGPAVLDVETTLEWAERLAAEALA